MSPKTENLARPHPPSRRGSRLGWPYPTIFATGTVYRSAKGESSCAPASLTFGSQELISLPSHHAIHQLGSGGPLGPHLPHGEAAATAGGAAGNHSGRVPPPRGPRRMSKRAVHATLKRTLNGSLHFCTLKKRFQWEKTFLPLNPAPGWVVT